MNKSLLAARKLVFVLGLAAGMMLAAVPAWSFTPVPPYSFTACGASGAFGPDQVACDSAYSGTILEGMVTVSGGIQSWTVPYTGMYQIEAAGATGGQQLDQIFGTGAIVSGEFQLTAGDVISIVVGQQGLPSPQGNWEGCGGGGASFVVLQPGNTPLLVAAGGAGGDGNGNYVDRLKPGGSAATGDPSIAAIVLPYDGCGNDQDPGCYGGSAGGGFDFDGANGYESLGGSSFLNGANGGTMTYGAAVSHGGFGGGGGASFFSMGGGGGGYQGADVKAGYQDTDGPRAALSFNGGTSQVNTDGTNQTSAAFLADGSVTITQLFVVETEPVPSLSWWAMVLLSVLLGVAAFSYRRIKS